MGRTLFLLLVIGTGWAVSALAQGVRGAAPVPASNTGRKVALVIGNRAYSRKPLVNSVNDAHDLGTLLQDQLGFHTTVKTDLNQEGMARAVEDFLSQVQSGDIALFYYAGHGMQIDGQNLLLPIDFDATDDIAAKIHAYQANQISGRLRGRGARMAIVILDACRDNPFRSWRSDSGGLAGMSGSGAFIAFAADEGKTAEDNPRDRNGLFTKHLLAELGQPGLTIDEVFNGVRANVFQESNGRQTPFVSSGIIGTFRFRDGSAPTSTLDLDVERYTAVKDSRDPDQLEAVANTIGRADLAGILRERARSLRSLSTASTPPSQSQQPASPGGTGVDVSSSGTSAQETKTSASISPQLRHTSDSVTISSSGFNPLSGTSHGFPGGVTLQVGTVDVTVTARGGLLYFRADSLSAGPVSCSGLRVAAGLTRIYDPQGATAPNFRYLKISGSSGSATLYVGSNNEVGERELLRDLQTLCAASSR